jgi:hypothetical protein
MSAKFDMNKSLLRLGAWARLLGPTVQGNTRTATAALLHRQAIDRAPALLAALAICGVLGGISLFVPPYIGWDSGWGFAAWRGTLLGAVNSVITPDPANIARDTVGFLSEWSPGQYLIPGAISLLGIPLGIAMTLTAALSALASLVGWVMVVETFAPKTRLALLAIVLVGLFRYSTMPFGVYQGGEILLQAETPWLVLLACRVPEMDAAPAALLAAAAVFFAFLAKLSGLITVSAALAAGSIVALVFSRRITRGMIGGALGALAVLPILYVTFFSRGPTAASVTSWSLPLRSIAFASVVPWVAGMSWTDLMTTIFLPARSPWYISPKVIGFVTPPALLVAGLVLFWRPLTTNEKRLKLFSLWFYVIVTAIFVVLYVHGATIGLEERFFRPTGNLLFLCALIGAFAAGTPRWARGLFLVLCALMALYGIASFSSRALTAANGRSLDRTSWTNQQNYDAAAVDFAKQAHAREGRNALFVVTSPQILVTLPTDARILNFEGGPAAARPSPRYAGRVPGHVFVLMPNYLYELGVLRHCDSHFRCTLTDKARALLSAFTDYAPDAWERKTFPNMDVFFQ